MRKVPSSWSVATGLISVRTLTFLPTTRGALLKPRILTGHQNLVTPQFVVTITETVLSLSITCF